MEPDKVPGLEAGGPDSPAFITAGQRAARLPPRLTQEEERLLRQCRKDSFLWGSVPGSCLLMAGTAYMVNTGRWKPSRTLGPVPKMVVASLAGYTFGEILYLGLCRQKLMELPDSPEGFRMRLHRTGGKLDAKAGAKQDAPYYQPTMVKPGSGVPSLSTADLQPAQNFTTYAELRRQNRAEAEAQLRRGAGPAAPRPPPPPQGEGPTPAADPSNKSGDVWDK